MTKKYESDIDESQKQVFFSFFPEVLGEVTKLWKTPFNCPELLPNLLHPHYPWWWGHLGVCRDSPGRECNCSAAKCHHLGESCIPPVLGRWVDVSFRCSDLLAIGQDTSNMNAMAILRIYQAKALYYMGKFWARIDAGTDFASELISSQRGPSARRCPHWWSWAPSLAEPCGDVWKQQSALSRQHFWWHCHSFQTGWK